MISINHLTKKLGKNVILDDVTLTLKNGKYGLLGPDGAGKTTLLRCLTDVYTTPKGSIVFDEENAIPRIGYLPQNFEAFQHMSVRDSMKYFCAVKNIKKSDRMEEISRCLQMVDMEKKQNVIFHKLSGGMRRRVGIAQAMLGDPDVILLDEPTVGLDPEERERFVSMISRIREDAIVLFSTHIIEDVEECCEQVIIMNQGKVCYQDSCDELLLVAEQRNRSKKDCETYAKATLMEGYMCVMKGKIGDGR